MSVSDRAKHELALHGRILAIVILLIGLGAFGGAGYVYLNPTVEEIPPQETDVQEFSSEVEHFAIVVNDTALYSEDQRLVDQPRYFYATTPVLHLSGIAEVPADRPVNVSHEINISIRATADGRVFYERERRLGAGEETVTDGEFIVNTTVDVPEVQQEITEIQNEIGALGSISTQLEVRTTYETQSTEGDVYAGTLNSSSAIQIAEEGYWLASELSDSTTERTLVGGGEQRRGPDMGLVTILSALGVVGIVLAGLVFYWSSRKVDLQELKMKIDRRQYAEWVSEGNFPTGSEKQYVYIDTLEDLVDVAIDTNKRVIFDDEIETYAVADGDIIYYHAPDPRAISSWLDLS